jgi:hypothetical protein
MLVAYLEENIKSIASEDIKISEIGTRKISAILHVLSRDKKNEKLISYRKAVRSLNLLYYVSA